MEDMGELIGIGFDSWTEPYTKNVIDEGTVEGSGGRQQIYPDNARRKVRQIGNKMTAGLAKRTLALIATLCICFR